MVGVSGLAQALRNAGVASGRNATRMAQAVKRAGGDKLVDRMARRVTPDTTEIGRTAAMQPAFVAQEGRTLGQTAVRTAGFTAVGGTTAAFGIPAATEAYGDYTDRQTQKEITESQRKQEKFIEQVLNDDSLSEEDKLAMLESLKQFTRPGMGGGPGLFDISLPFVGDVQFGPGAAVVGIIALFVILNAVRG